MKSLVIIFIICITYSLLACNGGNSSVPTYTSTNKTDTSPYTNNTEPAFTKTDRGGEIFRQRCIACHGMAGNTRNNNAANLQFSRLDSLSITEVIKNGRGVMPMFKGALADSDIGHLAVYVKSLRR
jgi:mono/diheme cytochrome c family protein